MSKLSRILAVEDEVLLLLDLVDSVADRGIEVIPVTSARGAISLIDADIDALITDIELPGSYNGLQLARLAARLRPGLPIAVVSGGVRPAPADLPPGAVFMPKPYRIEAVLAALERQIAVRAA
ncbi:response regulator [Devosia sp. YIM 151766]|uniref:response regulator n=1 Tax=Devosia sp. YIM 151766 TaxID=3017325 RepID=UPI00255D09EC|nr:response regulator [Devosia sp. YIM 151766]WIY51814.1 response regulator [Devosia sp. YIM 151766]